MRTIVFAPDLPTARVSAFEMQRKPAAFQRQVQREPVTITSNGEPTIVAMSVDEFRRLAGGHPPAAMTQATHLAERIGTQALDKSARSGLEQAAVIERLASLRGALQERGIAHLGIFGSVARDRIKPTSDIDIVVSLRRKLDLIELGAVQTILEEAFDGAAVDMLVEPIANSALRQAIEQERVDVF